MVTSCWNSGVSAQAGNDLFGAPRSLRAMDSFRHGVTRRLLLTGTSNNDDFVVGSSAAVA
jgi:hypothetical protein